MEREGQGEGVHTMSRFSGWGWMLLAWLAAGPVLELAAIIVEDTTSIGQDEIVRLWAPPSWLLLAAIVALLAAESYFSWRESGRW